LPSFPPPPPHIQQPTFCHPTHHRNHDRPSASPSHPPIAARTAVSFFLSCRCSRCPTHTTPAFVKGCTRKNLPAALGDTFKIADLYFRIISSRSRITDRRILAVTQLSCHLWMNLHELSGADKKLANLYTIGWVASIPEWYMYLRFKRNFMGGQWAPAQLLEDKFEAHHKVHSNQVAETVRCHKDSVLCVFSLLLADFFFV